MSDEKYDVLFKGELVRSFEPAVVKKNIATLFKVDGSKLEALFSGKVVVLKRNLSFDAATKYRVAIKKAGARVDLVPVEPALDTNEGDSDNAASSSDSLASPAGVGYAMTVAPAGADVLNATERKTVASVDVDTSSLSVKHADGDLLNPDEKTRFEPLDINLEGFDLAAVGEDLLKVSERKEAVPMEIDVSEFSVAEPGERLSEPSPEPPPAPDVTGISLEP